MNRIIWIYGLIIGTVLSINAIIMMTMMVNNKHFKGNDIIGYAAMVVMFSIIFFGVRKYRNSFNNGYISFGNAFKVGAVIALIGSSMYVLFGLGYYYLFVPEFLDKFIEHTLANCPQADLPAKKIEMANFREMYKNPLFAILISYMEVLPVGLIVSLISALILKTKRAHAKA